jgi:hypothetical protein
MKKKNPQAIPEVDSIAKRKISQNTNRNRVLTNLDKISELNKKLINTLRTTVKGKRVEKEIALWMD